MYEVIVTAATPMETSVIILFIKAMWNHGESYATANRGGATSAAARAAERGHLA